MSVPSLAPRLKASMAMKPLPPGRFSTTTGWPQARESLSATRRATPSGPPPTGNGVMMRTGLVGNCCAKAPIGSAAAVSAPAARARFVSERRVTCMVGMKRKKRKSVDVAQAGLLERLAHLVHVEPQHAGGQLFALGALVRFAGDRGFERLGG